MYICCSVIVFELFRRCNSSTYCVYTEPSENRDRRPQVGSRNRKELTIQLGEFMWGVRQSCFADISGSVSLSYLYFKRTIDIWRFVLLNINCIFSFLHFDEVGIHPLDLFLNGSIFVHFKRKLYFKIYFNIRGKNCYLRS